MMNKQKPKSVYDKRKLVKYINKIIKVAKKVFVSYYGEHLTDVLIPEVRKEFEALIPQLPDVGNNRTLTQFVVGSALYLATYRTLSKQGKPIEEIGRLVFEVAATYLQAVPKALRNILSKRSFTPRYLKKLQEAALESQKLQFPKGYVFKYVQGDGTTFDYGIDYMQCATCKFYEEQGARVFAPYVCPVDIIYSELLGWGLKRTQTLAEGFSRCDFRFKKGGKTSVSALEPMAEFITSFIPGLTKQKIDSR